ncbi:phosphatase PAP2 family protein [Halorhabdus sp. BNX81]|uniref:phosphatase PAP2 family protein n=1 Tax=Halorhabdus sp. BNX81 TaxID=2980181 RepID=UPI0023DD3D7A|nr:phosphatase PAP2 family protein [Halorhabdus sp. BNX81]WEL20167.1 Membrane-associated phospholipid phosphatase [Halorhabdus sp. BNX81]
MPTPDGAVWFGVSLVTFLGDPLVITGLGVTLYWFSGWPPGIGDRLDPERRALLFTAIVGGLALSSALKTGFAMERPPGAADLPGVAGIPDVVVPIYTWIVGPGGHAFPSGHATAATVGWLGVAWAYRGKHRTRALVLAGGLVAAIAASRVALGVHRPHEVLAGIGVGVVLLASTFDVLGRPRRAFALAGMIGVAGPVVVGLTGDSLLIAGVALGTVIGREWAQGDRMTMAVPFLTTLLGVVLVAGVTFVRSGAYETGLALAGVGGGATIVAGQRVIRRSKNE